GGHGRVPPGGDEGGDVGRGGGPGAQHDARAPVDERRVGQRDRGRGRPGGAVAPAARGGPRPAHQPSAPGAGARPSPDGRASAAMADRTPLTNRGESSVPNRRASTTASLRITAVDRSGTSSSS